MAATADAEQLAKTSALVQIFTAGVLSVDQLQAFKAYAKVRKESVPEAEHVAFKKKISDVMDSTDDVAEDKLKHLIKGIKAVIEARAVEQGKTGTVPEETKTAMKANLKGYFSTPVNNIFNEAYDPETEGSNDIKTTVMAIVVSFMAVGYTVMSAPSN